MDILNDFQCRKCTLVATLESFTKELELVQGKDDERTLVLSIDIGRLKDALRSNIEATLVTIHRLKKNTYFARSLAKKKKKKTSMDYL